MTLKTSPPSVSIITIIKKGGVYTFLDSLKNQKYDHPFEILIIEGGNRSQARNLGITQSKASLIAFIDADCEAPTTWIQKLVTSLSDDHNIAGVGGVSYCPESRSRLHNAINGVFSTYLGSLNSPSLISTPRNQRQYVNAISGHNCVYRKKSLMDVEGFDEKYELNEDTDICARLREKGYRLLLDGNVLVNHTRRDTISKFAHQFFWYGVGRFRSILTSRRNNDVKILGLFCITVLLALVTPFVPTLFLSALVAYSLIVGSNSLVGALRVGSITLSIVIIPLFVIEHVSYLIGLFIGLLSGPWREWKQDATMKVERCCVSNKKDSVNHLSVKIEKEENNKETTTN
jgi:GT2 family glycosyltransferase